jgi:hypothetical protein
MRAIVYVTDEAGKKYEGSVELSPVSNAAVPSDQTDDETKESAQRLIDFTLPIRAFVRTYAATRSNGAAKCGVLLARLAKGDDSVDVPAESLHSEWGRLTGHLGSFNRAHVTRAKDRAWIDSAGPRMYRLGPRWREAFGS